MVIGSAPIPIGLLQRGGAELRLEQRDGVKIKIELLRHENGCQKVLHAIEHESHNLQAVAAAVQGVVNSPELEVDSYRISTDHGDEIVGYCERAAKGKG
jgi:hypothetical protein